MSTRDPDRDLRSELSTWFVGGGVVTMALFPLLLPGLALVAVFAIPLVLPLVALGLAIAAIAAPVLAVRALGRMLSRASSRRALAGARDRSAGPPRRSAPAQR